MIHELSWRTFVYWVIAGMGGHLGWGLIGWLFSLGLQILNRGS